MYWRRLEVKSHIKSPCLFGQGMNQHCPDRNDVSGGRCPQERVFKQCPPKTSTSFRFINRQSRQKYDADRLIRRSFGYAGCCVLPVNAARRQRIISDYAVSAMDHIRGCEIALLIRAGKPLQPVIERLNSTAERIQMMRLSQFLRAG